MSNDYMQRARDIQPMVAVDLDHNERVIDGISMSSTEQDGMVGLMYTDGSWRHVPADSMVRLRPWP